MLLLNKNLNYEYLFNINPIAANLFEFICLIIKRLTFSK